MTSYLSFSPETLKAKEEGKPLVALESTIISHGMPFPKNIETAKVCEEIIRSEGAIPATIALHKGKIQVGFNEALFSHFADNPQVQKASRRDMPYYLSNNMSASTTVAATMHAAWLANIPFFATGGIGGVHRGAEDTFDISADLHALGDTPIVVVSAGAKAILDLNKTLEVLETLSVPVVGYQTAAFPAFYSHQSPYQLSHISHSPEEIVKLFKTQKALHLKNGMLVANPIPKAHELPFEKVAPLVEKAQSELADIKGKDVTPALLKKLTEDTQGETLKANIELIKNNAKLAAQLAVTYAEDAI